MTNEGRRVAARLGLAALLLAVPAMAAGQPAGPAPNGDRRSRRGSI
jgi:hypothetical protein